MSSKKIGITRFLGTNCDRDVWQAVEDVGLKPEWLWYQDHFDVSAYEAIVVPGGFSYGDYLRSGALAARMPVMASVKEAASKGTPILGICNGFQILCEVGLLPGALVRNENLRFIDEWVDLQTQSKNSYWGGSDLKECRIPIAHGDGRYFIESNSLEQLLENEQVWLTYRDNPNGSVGDVAGIMNKQKNVAGLMPHPERAMHNWMGDDSGRAFFTSLLN